MLLTELYMCSETCPCPSEAQSKYAELYSKEEGKKRFEAASRYMEGDVAMAGKKGFSKLVFAKDGDTYTQYSKCYIDKLEKQLESETNETLKDAYNSFKKDGL